MIGQTIPQAHFQSKSSNLRIRYGDLKDRRSPSPPVSPATNDIIITGKRYSDGNQSPYTQQHVIIKQNINNQDILSDKQNYENNNSNNNNSIQESQKLRTTRSEEAPQYHHQCFVLCVFFGGVCVYKGGTYTFDPCVCV